MTGVERKGFVFSFDAYVAFTLALTLIITLYLFISLPHPYYYEYEQTYTLATDIARGMETAGPSGVDRTYSEILAGDIISYGSGTPVICGYLENIIPDQYAYKLSFDSGELCRRDSRYDPTLTCDTYRKVRVTVPILITDYGVPPDTGYNPFGYNTCEGDPDTTGEELSPCDITYSTYQPGNLTLTLVNLTLCI